MDARVLAQVLRRLPPIDDPNVLVGTSTADDAGVYRLTDEIAIVQTVDFFTPIVDDPWTFGAIAAANALSDIYAMGARPLSALAIAAFPEDGLDAEVLAQILAGGADKAREAGINVIGGHTIKDAEPKYGLAVTGVVHPERIWRNSTARARDALILTKPLGTGILTTARKRDLIGDDILAPALTSMLQLNRVAADAATQASPHAATDITGFGLLGHVREMAQGSAVGATIESRAVPLFDRVLELARDGAAPAGTITNLDAAIDAGWLFADSVAPEHRVALCDAQTSGGLLIAVAPENAASLIASLHASGIHVARQIGEITADRTLRVV
jgi:selenide, water dikinase